MISGDPTTQSILYGRTPSREADTAVEIELPLWWPSEINLIRLSLYGRYSDAGWVGAWSWSARAQTIPDQWLPEHLIEGAAAEQLQDHRAYMKDLHQATKSTSLMELTQRIDLENWIDDENVYVDTGAWNVPRNKPACRSMLAAVETLAGHGGSWRHLSLPNSSEPDFPHDQLVYLHQEELYGTVSLDVDKLAAL